MGNTTEQGTARPGARRSASTFVYAVAGLVVAVLLLGAGGFLWLTGSTGGPAVGGPFTLENSSGKTVTDQDFRGKFMLVYFGYTYCPDVCPTTLNAVASALDKLGPKAKALTPIFITVDPQRDTPGVMKQYTAAFSPAIVGLTGTPDEIAKVAREYRVYYARHVTGPGPNDYSMDHSSILYLMGPNGRFIAPVRADESPAEMATEIEKLMS
ncbi:MAG TPA: SCO family protein [Acetobacteraceae bacterium]|jgi:protein SCO1|nr:SCO family protein [Acetobacteraceae bacterium]